jgi:hypothetical protein
MDQQYPSALRKLIICGTAAQWRHYCVSILGQAYPNIPFIQREDQLVSALEEPEKYEIILYGTWWSNPVLSTPTYKKLRNQSKVTHVE